MGALKALRRKFQKMKLRMKSTKKEPDVVRTSKTKPITKLTIKKRVMQTFPVTVEPGSAPMIKLPDPVPAVPEKIRKPEKKQEVRDATGKPIIWIDLERGNRVMVKWDAALTGLTQTLTYHEDKAMSIFGHIEELKAQSAMKKLIPLNFDNATMLLVILKGFLRGIDGPSKCHIELTDEFSEWYEAEHEANLLCADAHQLLEYDEKTVQMEYPFLKRTLKPWQGPGINFINAITRQGRGAFLCDETGLGKTIVIGGHLASMSYKAVVVCPAGLRLSWKRKLEEFTNLSCFVVDSKYPMDAGKYDVIIVSYAMLKKYGLWPLSELIEKQNRVLILDEGQAAKNYDSKRTFLCVALSRYARHSVVVTATPLKNRIAELHPLLRITRRLWTEMAFEAFVRCYTKPEAQVEIAEHLRKFMVRRMAHEVWKDAPKLEVGKAWLELSNRQDYMEAESDFIEWLRRNGADENRLGAAERGHALVKMNKLRQLAAEGKIETAAEILEKTMDHNEQVVVFSAFNEPLKKLAEKFAHKTGKNYKGQSWKGSALIIGSTPEVVRHEIIARFMAGEIGILCVGLNAGGVGIDLPIACYGYTLDLPWSPADFEQCSGRFKRIGQERNCQIIKCLATSTIDQRMEEIIQVKAHTFKRAIGDEGIVERVMGVEVDSEGLEDTIVTALLRSYLREAS